MIYCDWQSVFVLAFSWELKKGITHFSSQWRRKCMLTYSCHFKLFEISLMLVGARLSDLESVLLHRAAADVPLCAPSVAIPGQTQTLHFFTFILALTPSFQQRLQLSHGLAHRAVAGALHRHFYINPLIAIGWSRSLVFIHDQVLKSETLHLLWFFWGSESLQAVFSPHILCTHNCLSRDTFLLQLQIICSFIVRLHQTLHTMNGWS